MERGHIDVRVSDVHHMYEKRYTQADETYTGLVAYIYYQKENGKWIGICIIMLL